MDIVCIIRILPYPYNMKTKAKHIILIVGILVAYLAVTNNQTDTRRMRGFEFSITNYSTDTTKKTI